MTDKKHCFSCSTTKEAGCFTQAPTGKPAICNHCVAEIKARRRTEKRKASGEAMKELQARQKIEREAKEQVYYKPKSDKPLSNTVQHKANIDAHNERMAQRKIDEEIGDEY